MTSPKAPAALLALAGMILPTLGQAADDAASLRAELQALRNEYTSRVDALEARIAQLESRMAETRSEIGAATARHEEAQQTLERSQSLADAGTGTVVALERARRDATVRRARRRRRARARAPARAARARGPRRRCRARARRGPGTSARRGGSARASEA